jgi:hypothetical protein
MVSEFKRKWRVYVSGPYTKGDVEQNVRNAIKTGNDLADMGIMPFVPHLTHYWHQQHHRSYEFWLDLDLAFLPRCHAVLRLPGFSKGADIEEDEAHRLRIPVFTSIERLKVFLKFKEDVEAWLA